MSTKSVLCPRCSTSLDVPPSLIGQKVECPVCKEIFTIELPPEPPPQQSKEPSSFMPPPTRSMSSEGHSSSSWHTLVTMILSAIACILAVAALVLTLMNPKVPILELKKDLNEAVVAYNEWEIKGSALFTYFYRKNGAKILDSLDIREIKHNGNAAAVFYRLSLGATEVKKVVFLYQTREGYWIAISEEAAKKKFPENWLKDMKEKKERFEKDSGEFDEYDF